MNMVEKNKLKLDKERVHAKLYASLNVNSETLFFVQNTVCGPQNAGQISKLSGCPLNSTGLGFNVLI